MPDLIPMQSANCSSLDQGKLCSFDLEAIVGPTSPLIHQSARFLLINSGKGVIRLQNRDYGLSPGSLVAILPWQVSEVVRVDKPLQYYIVVYRIDTVNRIVKSFYNMENQPVNLMAEIGRTPVAHCVNEQLERVRGVFLAIRDEVGIESTRSPGDPQHLSGIYLTNALVELLVLFLRALRHNPDGAAEAPARMDRSEILHYMYNHLSEKLTLKMLSQRFYLSESAISQHITQMTGLSFFDLLNEMRVGKTINFLLYTDFTLDELADILGYVDASHVSKVFSARIGMKAGEYRKTYRKVGDFCKVAEDRKAYSVVAYLYRNYSKPLTPQGVAEEFSITVKELHRILVYQVERNFEDFLHYLRINRASELLLTTRKSVIDIAVEVGYNSAKTLTRNFLKLRLTTPGEFRKNVGLQPGLE